MAVAVGSGVGDGVCVAVGVADGSAVAVGVQVTVAVAVGMADGVVVAATVCPAAAVARGDGVVEPVPAISEEGVAESSAWLMARLVSVGTGASAVMPDEAVKVGLGVRVGRGVGETGAQAPTTMRMARRHATVVRFVIVAAPLTPWPWRLVGFPAHIGGPNTAPTRARCEKTANLL